MQLAILTAILGTIAAAEAGGGPVDGVGWRLPSILAAALAAPLAAYAMALRSALPFASYKGDLSDQGDHEFAARFETVIICLWLAGVAFILFVGQWPRIVRANWQLSAWPLADEIAILLPVIAPLFLIWAAMYCWQHTAFLADGETTEPGSLRMTRLWQYLLLQARHQLAIVLLPPLAVVGLIESVALLKIAPQIDAVWWFIAPQLAIVFVLMPLAVRRMWKTTPLRVQPLRHTLDEVCRSRGVRMGEILMWHTHGTMANAAVVGVSRFIRYLLLSDVLVCQLTSEQLAAVVRHELAHVRRWHLPLRLALLILPVACWIAMKLAFPTVEVQFTAALAALFPSGAQALSVVLPLAMLTYTVVVVGWYSRTLEHDADIDACLNESGQFDPDLAHHFCIALHMVCGDSCDSWFSRWLHPSLTARVSLLNRLSGQPSLAANFRRKANAVAIFIGMCYAIAPVLMLV